MKTFEVEDGGTVIIRNLTWIGPVQSVKKSSGKGKELIETTVFNFFMKSGFQSFKTIDFKDGGDAVVFRDLLLKAVENE